MSRTRSSHDCAAGVCEFRSNFFASALFEVLDTSSAGDMPTLAHGVSVCYQGRMNVFQRFTEHVAAAVKSLRLPGTPDLSRIVVEPPRDASHGDLATNAAMVLAKDAGMKPRELAEEIAGELRKRPEVTKADVAGPGFINMTLDPAVWRRALADAIAAGPGYGTSDVGAGKPVNVEFVSANPTGPMHVGHGRGAVFGDALANLLAFAGFKVAREYYINDAGAQVDALARSAFLRYREALGEAIGAIPDGLYPGDYLKPVVREEAGISCSRVRYLASQPWPFPFLLDDRLLRRSRDARGSRSTQDELEDARWFTRDEVVAMLQPPADPERARTRRLALRHRPPSSQGLHRGMAIAILA